MTLFVFSSLSIYSQNDALNYDKLSELQREIFTLHTQFNDYFQVMEHNADYNSMVSILDSYFIMNYVFEPLKVIAYVQNFHFTKSEKKLLENYQKDIIKSALETFELQKEKFNENKSYLSKEVMKKNIGEAIIIIDKTIDELKKSE